MGLAKADYDPVFGPHFLGVSDRAEGDSPCNKDDVAIRVFDRIRTISPHTPCFACVGGHWPSHYD